MDHDQAGERRRKAERLGHWAELAAAWLLRFKGYRIIARRARTPQGEIDLIAAPGRVIAFVEVKARPSQDEPLEAVTARHDKRIEESPHAWLAGNEHGADHDCRFDIITVSPYLWPKHLVNAFGEELW